MKITNDVPKNADIRIRLSVQFMLVILGLGHDDGAWQIFVLKSERVMGMDYLMKLAASSLIGTELGQRSDHKNDLNLG